MGVLLEGGDETMSNRQIWRIFELKGSLLALLKTSQATCVEFDNCHNKSYLEISVWISSSMLCTIVLGGITYLLLLADAPMGFIKIIWTEGAEFFCVLWEISGRLARSLWVELHHFFGAPILFL